VLRVIQIPFRSAIERSISSDECLTEARDVIKAGNQSLSGLCLVIMNRNLYWISWWRVWSKSTGVDLKRRGARVRGFGDERIGTRRIFEKAF